MSIPPETATTVSPRLREFYHLAYTLDVSGVRRRSAAVQAAREAAESPHPVLPLEPTDRCR